MRKTWWLLAELIDWWRHRDVPADRSDVLMRLRRVA